MADFSSPLRDFRRAPFCDQTDFVDTADQLLSLLFEVMFAAVSPASIMPSLFSILINIQLPSRTNCFLIGCF
jgi:hypothetical protein